MINIFTTIDVVKINIFTTTDPVKCPWDKGFLVMFITSILFFLHIIYFLAMFLFF